MKGKKKTNFTEQQQRQEICVGEWESNSVLSSRFGYGTLPNWPRNHAYRTIVALFNSTVQR